MIKGKLMMKANEMCSKLKGRLILYTLLKLGVSWRDKIKGLDAQSELTYRLIGKMKN